MSRPPLDAVPEVPQTRLAAGALGLKGPGGVVLQVPPRLRCSHGLSAGGSDQGAPVRRLCD